MLPAIAGLISSVGLSFFMQFEYLAPLLAVSLILAVGAFGFGAKRRRGYGPFVVGVVAAGVLILGKFVIVSDGAVCGGLIALVCASLWNSWPRSVSTVHSNALSQIESKCEEV